MRQVQFDNATVCGKYLRVIQEINSALCVQCSLNGDKQGLWQYIEGAHLEVCGDRYEPLAAIGSSPPNHTNVRKSAPVLHWRRRSVRPTIASGYNRPHSGSW